MAINHFSSGPALVVFDSVELGFCENGAEITIQPFYEDIHVDSWGGLAGPFADRQLLGAIAQVNCLMTKFDNDAVEALTSFTQGGAQGVVGSAKLGEFVYQDNLFSTLLLQCTTVLGSLQFDYAHVAGSMSFNQSMRHRRWNIQFLCRMDSPCLRRVYEYAVATSCFDD